MSGPKAGAISMLGKGLTTGSAAVATTASAAETELFIAGMTALQAQANTAALATASLSNEKALVDSLGKVIKGQGDSIKDAAPR